MSDDELSPGQRTLLASVERLAGLDPGGTEPPSVFRPVSWAPTVGPSFDLGAAIEASGPTPPERPGEGSGRRPDDAGTVPPPLPGVVAVAAAVNAGELAPAAALQACRRRIEALDGRINAVVVLAPERANRAAEAVEAGRAAGERPRPLAGVPILHKDILCTAGVPTAAGSRLLAGWIPDFDAAVVSRLENAGTLLLGKTNTHEFATGTTGLVSAAGAVRNPWNPEHVAGGSSSGSAAALAAGLAPAATGTDTGGSVRIPAACCGIVGLKPTYGRVSRQGVVPFAWSLDHVGPMARTVDDVAALLTAMAGPDPRDPASANRPGEDFRRRLEDGVDGLRIGLLGKDFTDRARADVAEAVRRATARLEGLGAERVPTTTPREAEDVGPIAIGIFLAEGGAVHSTGLARRPDAYQRETRAFLELAERVTGPVYLRAQRLRGRLCQAFARLLREVDLLLCPTLPVTAPRADARVLSLPEGEVDARATLTLFTRPFNLTGLPALSLPCGFDESGLPVGLQIVGRPFEEATVLRAAAALEADLDLTARWPEGFG